MNAAQTFQVWKWGGGLPVVILRCLVTPINSKLTHQSIPQLAHLKSFPEENQEKNGVVILCLEPKASQSWVSCPELAGPVA
jgi:hypothetical protein